MSRVHRIDLHGMPLEEALDAIERLIGEIRLRECYDEDIEVITGRGVIRTKLVAYLKAQDISFRFQTGNDGALFIYVDEDY